MTDRPRTTRQLIKLDSACCGQCGKAWPGLCVCSYVRGREAVMPDLFSKINLAKCEDHCNLEVL